MDTQSMRLMKIAGSVQWLVVCMTLWMATPAAAAPTGTAGSAAKTADRVTNADVDTKKAGSKPASATSTKAADDTDGDTPVAQSAEQVQPAKAKASPWAQSTFGLNQSASAISFNRGAEYDYNPFYALTLSFAPSWRINEAFSTSLSAALSREVTQADNRNRADEVWFNDISWTMAYAGYKIPVLGVVLGGQVTTFLPTSPLSQAQTLRLGVQPGVSISRRFNVLAGLSVAYRGGLRLNVHQFTTSETESPRLAGCRGQECARLLNTGVRNSQYQQSHAGSVSLTFVDWLSASVSVGAYLSHLYESSDLGEDEFFALEPMDTRYAMSFGLGLNATLPKGVTAGLGLSTFSPQRAPNNDFYRPFYNRFSQVYLDLRFRPASWF